MTVTPTPEMLRQIKAYKRFLETEQVFTYAYLRKEVFYYYIVFFRFGKPTGSLVLSDHPKPSHEDKLKAGYAFFHFNRVIFDSARQLIPDIKRPVELLHNVKRTIQKAIWTPELDLDTYREDIHSIQEALDVGIGTVDKLRDIFTEIQALEKSVLDRRYLQDDDVEKMLDLNIAHMKAMYHQGQEMIRVLPLMNNLKKHLDSLKILLRGEKEKLQGELFTALDALTEKSNVKVLMQSNASFEKDEYDKPLQLAQGEEGLRQLDGIIRRKNRVVFDHIITKDIRNL